MKITGLKTFVVGTPPPHFGGFHSDILKKPIQWQDGYVLPLTEPGIGVELDEEVALANPYDGKMLHLEMHPEPVV